MTPDPLVRHKVTVTGKPDAARTIVFINGIGTDQLVWRHVTPAFAAEYRIVTFDHVGSVPSNFADFRGNQVRYLNAKGYALDLLDICTALNLPDDTLLVGHSLGAVTAMLAAARQPGRLGQLILIGASPRYLDADDYTGGFTSRDIEKVYEALRLNYRSWAEAFAAHAMGAAHGQPTDRMADALVSVPEDMMLTTLCAVLQGDHRSMLSQLKLPTLIVQSRVDYFVPLAVAEYLQRQIAGSELAVIDAEGHLPHISAPDALIAVMQRFMAAHGCPPATPPGAGAPGEAA